MTLPFFIAWRYLFTKQREPLEWFTTAVSLLGVAIGVGTMIAVVGVMDGLQNKTIEEVLSWVAQIEIMNPAWREAEPGAAVLERINTDPEVAQAVPVLRTSGLISVGSGNERFQSWIYIYGVDRLEQASILGIHMKEGSRRPIESGEVIVSDSLTTKSLIGREVVITSGQRLKKSIYPVFPSTRLKVSGTFTGADREFQNRWAFIAPSEARRLAIQPGGISYIHVKLRDPMKANDAKARLATVLPPRTLINTWTEDFERMFTAMRVMKAGMLLVMLMTIVVAALNIIGTLTLIIVQKTAEIGIMKAIGATDRMVARIFMYEGMIVGLVGAFLGAAMGLGFLAIVQQFHIKMPAELFHMKTIPVEIHLWTVLALMAGAIVVCTLAATLPARHAAKLRPVAALRC
ncbi:ABC transporter permease [bacterium]|nr:ABC transporter permease [bacterium]